MGKNTEELETVARHCHNLDCIYRSSICGGKIPICFYAAIEHQVRGCKISECDRYVAGEKIKPRMTGEYVIWWELDLYDGDVDPFW